MKMGLDGKVAIVTGSSRGIGAGIAQRLSKDGAKVVMTARGAGQLKKTADLVREQSGGEVLAIPADAGSATDVDAMFKQVMERWGTVDMWSTTLAGPAPSPTFWRWIRSTGTR
jgi:3-oxoacyl-[acyl-carrier protein] reductase